MAPAPLATYRQVLMIGSGNYGRELPASGRYELMSRNPELEWMR